MSEASAMAVLRQVRQTLARPAHWAQGDRAREKELPTCIGIAIELAAQNLGVDDDPAMLRVARAIAPDEVVDEVVDNERAVEIITDWNDDPARAHAEVIGLLDRVLG